MPAERWSLHVGPLALDVGFAGDVASATPQFRELYGSYLRPQRGEMVAAQAVPARVVPAQWTAEPVVTLDCPFEEDEQPRAVRVAEDDWFVERWALRGSFGPSGSRGTYAVDRERSIENMARTAAAFALMPTYGLMFHAATLVFGEQAILFVGHSGAGKSTLAREGGADRVLTNELSIVARRGAGWWAYPSPFWGHGDVGVYAEGAPLVGVAVLSHGATENVWQQVTGTAALTAVMPHLGLMAAGHLSDSRILRAVLGLTSALPVYTFAWHRPCDPLEGSPWKR